MTPDSPHPAGWGRAALVVVLVLLATVAGVVAVRGGSADAQPPGATRADPPSGTPTPLAATGGPTAAADGDAGEDPDPDPAAARPTRLTIPAIGVDSRMERLGIDASGALVPPRHPMRAGWYSAGPAPGDLGPAVLAGHVDSLRGPAVFWRLSTLHRGDLVTVTRADTTTVRFRVTDVRHVDRARFPTRAVYGPVPDRALRLITCGGTYDHARGRYRQNVVVFALAI